MSFNLSELFEQVADKVPERMALHSPARALTYAELDERANRLAHHLRDAGIGRGETVGLLLQNGTEYLECMLAAFKLSSIPVNLNYRYVVRELEHLFDDADLVALVFHRQFGPVVADVLPATPRLRHLVAVDDGSEADLPGGTVDYESVLASSATNRDWLTRSGDDLYMTYTAGTTGMPKGVVWRHKDLFFAALGGGDPMRDKGPIGKPDELSSRVGDTPLVLFVAPPLMHVSGHWGAFNGLLVGWTIVLGSPGRFDPDEIWQLVADRQVNSIIVVGDAMANPLIDKLGPDVDTSSLFVLGSGGAILSPATKERIVERLPNVIVIDTFASSETGTAATRTGGDQRFAVDDRTAVLDDVLRPVVPGSGQVGRVGRRGNVPLRYHKDEAKSAATFVEFDGQRWVLPGDMATVAADGTVELLGRGSGCINTGGEKVFPEEVESVLKGHSDIVDVLVVGIPDERLGSKVAAVIQPRAGAALDLLAIQDHARPRLAGYKLPRAMCLVDEVRRDPNGKPDYPWAQAYANEHLT